MNLKPVINVWTENSTYKAATCKCCLKKIKEGEPIVGISQAQGSFNSISNYHLNCAEPILNEIMDETGRMMNTLLSISQQIKQPQAVTSEQ